MRNIHNCYVLVTLYEPERVGVHGEKACSNFNVFCKRFLGTMTIQKICIRL